MDAKAEIQFPTALPTPSHAHLDGVRAAREVQRSKATSETAVFRASEYSDVLSAVSAALAGSPLELVKMIHDSHGTREAGVPGDDPEPNDQQGAVSAVLLVDSGPVQTSAHRLTLVSSVTKEGQAVMQERFPAAYIDVKAVVLLGD